MELDSESIETAGFQPRNRSSPCDDTGEGQHCQGYVRAAPLRALDSAALLR